MAAALTQPCVPPAAVDPALSAREAGLRHASDGEPGLARRRAGRGFCYHDAQGRLVRDPATLARIRRLAIPPAWRDVWICADERGHLQATGRDARGRKQYRYHPRWRETRDGTKYGKLLAFGAALPAIRARVESDLTRPGVPREKVLACVVRLLDETHARVGNDEYARTNGSYGLTTILNDHAEVRGARVRLRFRGKAGVEHEVEVDDPRIARLVRRCQGLPGEELFCYQDEAGGVRDVKSEDVNAYLREAAGDGFTAKDFRTWGGTVLALEALAEAGPFGSQAEGKRRVVAAIKRVAARLGNTPAVCRKSYVHPAVVECYLAGEALEPGEDALMLLLARRRSPR
ncbi:MAG: topoisomerase [Thermoplasmata archaeon]|jgi:DNA topoisomerase-1|nr:topoisomerase [Thermoplasmata archaeon]